MSNHPPNLPSLYQILVSLLACTAVSWPVAMVRGLAVVLAPLWRGLAVVLAPLWRVVVLLAVAGLAIESVLPAEARSKPGVTC